MSPYTYFVIETKAAGWFRQSRYSVTSDEGWEVRDLTHKQTISVVGQLMAIRPGNIMGPSMPHRNRTTSTELNLLQHERNCGKRGLDDEQTGR